MLLAMPPMPAKGRGSNRQRDLWRVFEAVSAGRAGTRSELGEIMNLRSTTISSLVGALIERRLLLETATEHRGRGRPAGLLVRNNQRFGAIALQATSRAIEGHAINLAGQSIATARAEPAPDSGNAALASALRDIVARLQPRLVRDCELCGIACALPGLLEASRNLWCFSSRWPQMRNLSIDAALEGLAGQIRSVRDLDAELIARLDELDGPGAASVPTLLLHWGYGVGAAYAVDGAIVSGSRGRFCEIGHWRLGAGQGRQCACGNHDCLETVAALWSLGPRLRERWPELPIEEDGLARVAHEVPLAEHPAMAEAITQMERMLANLCRLLFPGRIILTGPFTANPEIFERLRAALSGDSSSPFFGRPVVIQGQGRRAHAIQGALKPIFSQAVAGLITSAARPQAKAT